MNYKDNRWSEEEKQLLIQWRKEGLSFKEIAIDLAAVGYKGRTTKAIIRAWDRYKEHYDPDLLEDEAANISKEDLDNDYSDIDCYKEDDNLFNYMSFKYKDEIDYKYRKALDEMEAIRKKALSSIHKWDRFVGNPAKDADIKVVSLSDTHIPFHNNEVIDHLLNNHMDADILVLNGDILEHYSVSSWPKSKTVMLRHEYEIGLRFIRLMADIFPKVIITRGNHEERLQKHFASNLDENVSFMVNPDILDRMANGYDFNDDGDLEKMYQMENVFYTKGPTAYFCQVGKCIFAHPSSYSGVPMRTVFNACDGFAAKGYDFEALVIGHCFDEETEILTKQGWKSIYNIDKKDNPATLNINNGNIEFNKCEGIFIHDHHEELILFKNNSGLEIAVTPEHGMLYRTEHGVYDNTKWIKKNAEEIENLKRLSVPSSGILQNNENTDISDEMIKIIAWVLTEGNISYTSANNPYIRIAQSDDGSGFIYEIEELLSQLDLEFSKEKKYDAKKETHGQYRNYDAYRFYITVDSSKEIMKYINRINKTLDHDFMMSLSLRQRKLLIEEMCKGDGSKCGTNHYCQYYTSNKELLNQFQTLCILSGIRAKANIKKEDGTWVISMTDTNMHTVTETERIKNNGKTWCLTVPNGTLIARRKGVPFITQNTHKMGKIISNRRLLIEQGCSCIPLEYEATSKMAYKPQAFGYAVVYMDKDGHVDFHKSNPVYCGSGSIKEEKNFYNIVE